MYGAINRFIGQSNHPQGHLVLRGGRKWKNDLWCWEYRVVYLNTNFHLSFEGEQKKNAIDIIAVPLQICSIACWRSLCFVLIFYLCPFFDNTKQQKKDKRKVHGFDFYHYWNFNIHCDHLIKTNSHNEIQIIIKYECILFTLPTNWTSWFWLSAFQYIIYCATMKYTCTNKLLLLLNCSRISYNNKNPYKFNKRNTHYWEMYSTLQSNESDGKSPFWTKAISRNHNYIIIFQWVAFVEILWKSSIRYGTDVIEEKGQI